MSTYARVAGGDIGHEHIGMITDSGYEVIWLQDLPLHHGGASLKVEHIDSRAPQAWDLHPEDVLWLRVPEPEVSPPARWLQIAETIAEEVTAPGYGPASRAQQERRP